MGQRNFDKTGCSCERMKRMMTIEVISKDAISITKEFNQWLEDMAEIYGWDKDDVQALIKQFLM